MKLISKPTLHLELKKGDFIARSYDVVSSHGIKSLNYLGKVLQIHDTDRVQYEMLYEFTKGAWEKPHHNTEWNIGDAGCTYLLDEVDLLAFSLEMGGVFK